MLRKKWKTIFGTFFICIGLIKSRFIFSGDEAMNLLLQEGEESMEAVDKTLDYFQSHPKALTDDVQLGVIIARSNLQWIFNRFRLSHDAFFPYENIQNALQKCDRILELNARHSSPLLNRTLWNDEVEDIKYGTLRLQNDDNFVLPNFDSCQSIDSYLMKGAPYDSDTCINELFRSDCAISDYCWLSEMKGNFCFGYKTTHRLIYLQAASKLHCQKKNIGKFFEINGKKMNLCRKILMEARAIYKNAQFPLIRDLFLEQIAVCGLEGFAEFGLKKWRKDVRNWQSKKGCFGQDMLLYSNCSTIKWQMRSKKTDTIVDECHSHVTAVALSAMTFHLRLVLKESLALP